MAGTGIELATAYLSLIPSLRGASKQIQSQLAGIDVDDAGSKLGKQLGGKIGASLDTASISTRLSEIGDAVSGVGDKMSDIGGKLTAGVTVPLLAGAAAAGKFAMGIASSAETTEISFTTMLGSEQAALDMMKTLADFAARTPFELSGLQDATRQLLAYGFTAEEIIPMLTSVGDATAALGTGQSGIEAVTRALGQMQTRGKVSAEEMLQLTEQGIPAWEYLAEAIGTDTAGAMEKVSDGAVDASTGIKALTDGMERDFGGMMEAQSKTVAGLFSNLSDAIEQPFMELRNSDAYSAFADAMEEVVDAAGPFVESLLPHMERGIEAVADLLGSAADAMEDFSSMSEDGQEQVLGLVAGAAAAGPALTVLGKGVSAAGSAMKGAGKLFEAASGAMGGAGVAAGGLSTGLIGVGTAIGALALGAVIANLADMAAHEKMVEDATRSASDIIKEAESSVSEYGETLGSIDEYTDSTVSAFADLNNELARTAAEQERSGAKLDYYVGVIEGLANQSGLTASEQEKLKNAVEGYNEITGHSVEVTDAVNGKISESVDSLKASAKAWEENAKAQAYASAAQGYYEELANAQLDASKAQKVYNDTLNEQNLRIADATKKFNAGMMSEMEYNAVKDDAKAKIGDVARALDEQNAAMDSAAESAEYMITQSQILGSSLESNLKDALVDLPESMQQGGYDIAMALSDGMEQGSLEASDAVNFIGNTVKTAVSGLSDDVQPAGMEVALALADGISSGNVSVSDAGKFLRSALGNTLSGLSPEMQQKGIEVIQSLADGMASGQITIDQASLVLKAAVTGDFSTLPAELQPYGQQAAAALGGSLSASSYLAQQGSSALASAAKSGVAGVPGSMAATGTQSGASLASTMGAQYGAVSGSSSSLASAAQGGVAGVPSSMGTSGTQGGQLFASGVALGEGPTSSAAGSLANATTAAKSNNSKASGWGSELGRNFANGISAAWDWVSNAASSLASAAASFLHFSEPDVGPLVGINDSGYELGKNYADAMMRAVPLVARSAERMASAASFEASPELSPTVRPVAARAAASSGKPVSNTYNLYLDGSRIGGGAIEKEVMRLFAVMHREGVM